MKLTKILLPVALSLVVLGAGCSLTQTINVNSPPANTNLSTSLTISYHGQDQKNALQLLQADHTVDVSAQGFVNAIDNRKPKANQYWAFYVNGKLADVGAKDYSTKKTDTIEWKLESF